MENKTVIITGGSRGIGAECVKAFAKAGYNVAFNYKNSKQQAQNLLEELKNYSVFAYKADVSKYAEMEHFFSETINKFGKVDVLINNAGLSLQKLFIDCKEEDFDNIINTNIKGVFYSSKLAVNNMLINKSGKIINISSIWGEIGGSCESVYSATKAAVIGLTKALAKEYGLMNITVNAVSPGYIETDMNKNFTLEEKQEIQKNIALNRLGKPCDISEVCLFLASDKANYITGQVISVNGGF